MTSLSSPVKLTASDDTASFDCGQFDLNDWLARFALANQRASMATVFVAKGDPDTRVRGYYALATGGVEELNAPDRVKKGVARHPIPVVLLSRLAVDVSMQGRGLGRALLRDALVRVSAAADEIGVRALLIHTKDDSAREFYMKQAEFEPSPTDELHLFLLMKDLRQSLKK